MGKFSEFPIELYHRNTASRQTLVRRFKKTAIDKRTDICECTTCEMTASLFAFRNKKISNKLFFIVVIQFCFSKHFRQ